MQGPCEHSGIGGGVEGVLGNGRAVRERDSEKKKKRGEVFNKRDWEPARA